MQNNLIDTIQKKKRIKKNIKYKKEKYKNGYIYTLYLYICFLNNKS